MPCYLEEFGADKTEAQKIEIETTWKSACKRSLRNAQKKAGRDLRVAGSRAQGYMTLQEELKLKYPKASHKAIREMVMKKVTRASKGISRCLINSEEGRAALEKAKQARREVLAAKAAPSEDLPEISAHGVFLDDATLQFFTDLTPDGANKDLFICRVCCWCTWNHLWLQELIDGILHHHFRCPMCITLFQPWVERDSLLKFNKVIITSDPDDEEGEYQVLPTLWPSTAEEKFLNILKEYSAGVKKGGDIKYESAQKDIETILMSKKNIFVKFEDHMAPKAELIRADIRYCKGYDHHDITPKIMSGFFLEGAHNIAAKDVFQDVPALCNMLSSLIPSHRL